jgi:hypothetical protein
MSNRDGGVDMVLWVYLSPIIAIILVALAIYYLDNYTDIVGFAGRC